MATKFPNLIMTQIGMIRMKVRDAIFILDSFLIWDLYGPQLNEPRLRRPAATFDLNDRSEDAWHHSDSGFPVDDPGIHFSRIETRLMLLAWNDDNEIPESNHETDLDDSDEEEREQGNTVICVSNVRIRVTSQSGSEIQWRSYGWWQGRYRWWWRRDKWRWGYYKWWRGYHEWGATGR